LAGLQVVTEDGTLISKSGIMTGGDSTIFESKLKQRASGERDKLEEKYRKNHAALEVP
jgi:chromosome segregation ATPase